MDNVNDSRPSIPILLVRHEDFRSKVGALLSRGTFSHASIGLTNKPNTFYSFAYKGFRTEYTVYLVEHTPAVPARIIRIPCSKAQEQELERIIAYLLQHKQELRYNAFGLVLAYFGIPFARQNRYFCSQFVALVLNRVLGIGTRRWARTFLPDGLLGIRHSELLFDGVSAQLA